LAAGGVPRGVVRFQLFRPRNALAQLHAATKARRVSGFARRSSALFVGRDNALPEAFAFRPAPPVAGRALRHTGPQMVSLSRAGFGSSPRSSGRREGISDRACGLVAALVSKIGWGKRRRGCAVERAAGPNCHANRDATPGRLWLGPVCRRALLHGLLGGAAPWRPPAPHPWREP